MQTTELLLSLTPVSEVFSLFFRSFKCGSEVRPAVRRLRATPPKPPPDVPPHTSPGASSMSRSQLGPWPLWCRPRASGSPPRGNPGETGPGSRGFCAAPPERGHGRSGPDPRWTGTAPARTCSSPRMKGGTGRPEDATIAPVTRTFVAWSTAPPGGHFKCAQL